MRKTPRISSRKSNGKTARVVSAPRIGTERRRRLRILITAGPTREYIDPVRFLSNESSGRMGVATASAALRRGHAVTLIHGPIEVTPPSGVRRIPAVSAADMLAACRDEFAQHDVLIMAAAVADYRPDRAARSKLKKTAGSLRMALVPTVDVLSALSSMRRPGQLLIGFALEDRDARRRAAEKLRRKRLDAIVLNSPAALSSDTSHIAILERGGRWTEIGTASKARHGAEIIRLVERLAEWPPAPKR